jgi:hypothetical protein
MAMSKVKLAKALCTAYRSARFVGRQVASLAADIKKRDESDPDDDGLCGFWDDLGKLNDCVGLAKAAVSDVSAELVALHGVQPVNGWLQEPEVNAHAALVAMGSHTFVALENITVQILQDEDNLDEPFSRRMAFSGITPFKRLIRYAVIKKWIPTIESILDSKPNTRDALRRLLTIAQYEMAEVIRRRNLQLKLPDSDPLFTLEPSDYRALSSNTQEHHFFGSIYDTVGPDGPERPNKSRPLTVLQTKILELLKSGPKTKAEITHAFKEGPPKTHRRNVTRDGLNPLIEYGRIFYNPEIGYFLIAAATANPEQLTR